MLDLTPAEISVLFHIVNNCHGTAFEEAKARAIECDGMSHEDFLAAYRHIPSILANA